MRLAFDLMPNEEPVDIRLLVALIAAAASLSVAALGAIGTRLGDAATRRRDGYTQAIAELFAWAELPFRVRRRASNSAAERVRLGDHGHELQQAIRCRQTWVRSENAWVGRVLADVVDDLRAIVAPSLQDAWASPPIRTAAGMNLNGWGPQGVEEVLARLESAIRFRFGWRRAVALIGWHPGAKASRR